MAEIIRALSYRVVWGHDVGYERAPRVQVKTNHFDLDLFGRELRATLKGECSTIEQARTQVEDYLRGWEIVIGISEHPDAVRFVYERAEVEEEEIDPETGHRVLHAKVQIETSTNLSAAPHVSRGNYPQPADPFRMDSVVEALYARYNCYQVGGVLLTSMAYFCLTVLERSAGGKRKAAATKYGIANKVLNSLGHLCSERGTAREARKAPNGLAFTPLNQREGEWVLAAVRLIIWRAGEVATCPDILFTELTMQDLPDLSDPS